MTKPVFYELKGIKYCDLDCPFFRIDKSQFSAVCKLDNEEITYYDWYLAHCKESNNLTKDKKGSKQGKHNKCIKPKEEYKKNHTEYKNWIYMIADCYPGLNKSTTYETKGIKVQDSWRGTRGFWEFLKDMGPKPKSYHLVRKDKNKNFTKDNCVWCSKVCKVFKV